MRALTIKQPYASLIAAGIKQYETRHFQPRCIQPGDRLLIHAGKSVGAYERRVFASTLLDPYRAALNMGSLDELPRGVLLCVVRLVSVQPVADVLPHISRLEQAVGDYRPGRYAWRLRVSLIIPRSTVRGRQGLWEYPYNERR
jgi:hypothetical protein